MAIEMINDLEPLTEAAETLEIGRDWATTCCARNSPGAQG